MAISKKQAKQIASLITTISTYHIMRRDSKMESDSEMLFYRAAVDATQQLGDMGIILPTYNPVKSLRRAA
jgi:hypothetical protein